MADQSDIPVIPMSAEVAGKLKVLPKMPGVYVFKDVRGKPLYVGKSVSLRDRVYSYFHTNLEDARKELMVRRIADLDTFVTRTAEEALILEYELITRYQPPFNIVFRDDKSYPVIKITNEQFPRAIFTRKIRKDGGTYLGPYSNAGAVRRTLELVTELFKLRTCSYPSSRLLGVKLCLQYHIKRCTGPCEQKVSAEEYAEQVKDATAFLRGREEDLVRELEQRMQEASASLQFEKAARLRDQIEAVRSLKARQAVSAVSSHEGEVVSIAQLGERFCIQQVTLRGGRIAGQRKLEVRADGRSPAEVLGEYVKQHYLTRDELPPEIVVSERFSEMELLEASLARRAGKRVEVRVPERGRWRELMEMARQNARLYLEAREAQEPEESALAGMQELKDVLALPELPTRIEGFDISTLQGGSTVASMVCFSNGMADKPQYRRFRIRRVEGQDDFASMFEVVSRRYDRLQREEQELPKLIMIDGGKGQLAAASSALFGLGLNIPICSLAKREEIIHSRNHPDGIALGQHSPGRRLLERVRNEAHRFAVSYHRKLRGKKALVSFLDEIVGIGPATRAKLLRAFRDPRRIKEASEEELAEVVSRNVAAAIHRYFHQK